MSHILTAYLQAQVQAWDPTENHDHVQEEWRIQDENGTFCVWCPPRDRPELGRSINISEDDIAHFEQEAVETYGFKPEQALGQ